MNDAPYINASGDLVIPSSSPPRFHYWKEDGQRIIATLKEIGATDEQIARHTPTDTSTLVEPIADMRARREKLWSRLKEKS